MLNLLWAVESHPYSVAWLRAGGEIQVGMLPPCTTCNAIWYQGENGREGDL